MCTAVMPPLRCGRRGRAPSSEMKGERGYLQLLPVASGKAELLGFLVLRFPSYLQLASEMKLSLIAASGVVVYQ